MGHIKNIITGVLSGAVLFIALQVGTAQEKVNTPTNKAEVKISDESRLTMTYYFTGASHSDSQIQNLDNWESSQGDLECNGETLLCEVQFDAEEYDSIEEFLTENNTASKIKDNAVSYTERNP